MTYKKWTDHARYRQAMSSLDYLIAETNNRWLSGVCQEISKIRDHLSRFGADLDFAYVPSARESAKRLGIEVKPAKCVPEMESGPPPDDVLGCATCQRSDGVSAECCGGDPQEKKCPGPGLRCPLCPECGKSEAA